MVLHMVYTDIISKIGTVMILLVLKFFTEAVLRNNKGITRFSCCELLSGGWICLVVICSNEGRRVMSILLYQGENQLSRRVPNSANLYLDQLIFWIIQPTLLLIWFLPNVFCITANAINNFHWIFLITLLLVWFYCMVLIL